MDLKKLETLTITEISGVDSPANQLDGWMVTKARAKQGRTVLDAVRAILNRPRALTGVSDETLTKAIAVFGFATPLVATGEVEVIVEKARHAVRSPQGSFQKSEPETNIGGVHFRHGGNVHETIRRLAAQRGGKREPGNDASKIVPGMYGDAGSNTSAPGNP